MEGTNITCLQNAIPTPYHKYEYVSAYGNSAFRNTQSEGGLEKLSLDIVMELVKYLRHPSPLWKGFLHLTLKAAGDVSRKVLLL